MDNIKELAIREFAALEALREYLEVKELTKKEETTLRKHAESIIIKGAKSPDRLLDEVSLFLHRVEQHMPDTAPKDLNLVGEKDEVLKVEEGRHSGQKNNELNQIDVLV